MAALSSTGDAKGHILYTLDLVTLLRLLSEFRRTGILQAELSAGLPQIKKPCLAVVELLDGEMVACQVKEARGQTLLTDQEAYETVATQGKLNWDFRALPAEDLPSKRQEAKLSSGLFPTPKALTGPLWAVGFSLRSWVPQRVLRLNNSEINTWPRRYRQVYILIDGVRDVEKIAAMLSQPVQFVEEVLREMQATGTILLQER